MAGHITLITPQEADRVLDEHAAKYRAQYGSAAVWFLELSEEARLSLLRRLELTSRSFARVVDPESKYFVDVVSSYLFNSGFVDSIEWSSRRLNKSHSKPDLQSIKWVVSYYIDRIIDLSRLFDRGSIDGRDYSQKLLLADEFVRNNPGMPISDFLRELFPEARAASPLGQTATPDLPPSAPARWSQDRLPDESPTAFIRRHYQPWLGKGLTRADIYRLDRQLDMALRNWLRKNDLPEGFDLPTKKELNDRLIAALEGSANPSTTLGDLAQHGGVREIQRLANAMAYREKKGRGS